MNTFVHINSNCKNITGANRLGNRIFSVHCQYYNNQIFCLKPQDTIYLSKTAQYVKSFVFRECLELSLCSTDYCQIANNTIL